MRKGKKVLVTYEKMKYLESRIVRIIESRRVLKGKVLSSQ